MIDFVALGYTQFTLFYYKEGLLAHKPSHAASLQNGKLLSLDSSYLKISTALQMLWENNATCGD